MYHCWQIKKFTCFIYWIVHQSQTCATLAKTCWVTIKTASFSQAWKGLSKRYYLNTPEEYRPLLAQTSRAPHTPDPNFVNPNPRNFSAYRKAVAGSSSQEPWYLPTVPHAAFATPASPTNKISKIATDHRYNKTNARWSLWDTYW